VSVETLTCVLGKPGEYPDRHDWLRGDLHRVCDRCEFVEYAFTRPPALPLGATDFEWAWYYYGPTQVPI
jgi:hypothetical protein